jgi:LPXTG-motif cell wall-anchored protein
MAVLIGLTAMSMGGGLLYWRRRLGEPAAA